MKNRKLSNQKGVTLVELLIYMGLLAILLVLLTDMLVSILEVRTEIESTTAVEQDGRYLLTRLAYDIYRADSIVTPAAPGDSGNTLSLVISGDSYLYANNSGKFEVTTPLGTNQLNSSGSTISSVSFTRLGSIGDKNTIKVSFTVTSTTQRTQGYEVKSYTTTYGVRK